MRMNIKTEENCSNGIFITELHEIITEQKTGEMWVTETVGADKGDLASLRGRVRSVKFLFKFEK